MRIGKTVNFSYNLYTETLKLFWLEYLGKKKKRSSEKEKKSKFSSDNYIK